MTGRPHVTDGSRQAEGNRMSEESVADEGVIAACRDLTVGELIEKQARIQADAIAVDDYGSAITYQQLDYRASALAGALACRGIRPGDRVAILSENRREYLELEIACAKAGAVAACLNWRMSSEHLGHCARLVDPRMLVASPRFAGEAAALAHDVGAVIEFGDEYEALVQRGDRTVPRAAVRPEDGLLILYTSGTTGLPKGALISHRAMVWRAALYMAETGITRHECFVSWSPLFHMAGSDYALGTFLLGGKVVLVDGVDLPRLITVIENERIGYLPVVSGMVERLADTLKAQGVRPQGIRLIGAMADLLPPEQLAEITTLLDAPFLNSFGMTEVGTGPASGNQIPVGARSPSLRKRESTYCLVRLVDDAGDDVPTGVAGEAVVRGPSLFSGYWNDGEATRESFRGGWYHTGDVFVRHEDGSLDWVERKSFMIKSGGENIYPAEIERVLLDDPRISEACIVPKRDPTWGEVPVAFIARRDPALSEAEVVELCRRRLGPIKRPKEVRFIALDEFPRNAAGKIERRLLVARLGPEDRADAR